MWGRSATFVEQEQQAPSQNDPKKPWQGIVLNAAEEGKKKPQGHLLAHRGAKKPSSHQVQGTRGHLLGA